MTRSKSIKLKNIVLWVLVIGLLGAVIGIGIKLNKTITTKEIPATEFSRCSINTSTGATATSEESIASNYITVDGLEIEIKEDATVTYKVFFYGESHGFISATSSYDSDFDGEIPSNAVYCRILITPVADTSISALEVLTYANQLTVTVNK